MAFLAVAVGLVYMRPSVDIAIQLVHCFSKNQRLIPHVQRAHLRGGSGRAGGIARVGIGQQLPYTNNTYWMCILFTVTHVDVHGMQQLAALLQFVAQCIDPCSYSVRLRKCCDLKYTL